MPSSSKTRRPMNQFECCMHCVAPTWQGTAVLHARLCVGKCLELRSWGWPASNRSHCPVFFSVCNLSNHSPIWLLFCKISWKLVAKCYHCNFQAKGEKQWWQIQCSVAEDSNMHSIIAGLSISGLFFFFFFLMSRKMTISQLKLAVPFLKSHANVSRDGNVMEKLNVKPFVFASLYPSSLKQFTAVKVQILM